MCYCYPPVLTGTRMLCKPHGSHNYSHAVKTIYCVEQLGRAFSEGGCINLTKFRAYKRAVGILKASTQLLRQCRASRSFFSRWIAGTSSSVARTQCAVSRAVPRSRAASSVITSKPTLLSTRHSSLILSLYRIASARA
jgi:hypothetical protein